MVLALLLSSLMFGRNHPTTTTTSVPLMSTTSALTPTSRATTTTAGARLAISKKGSGSDSSGSGGIDSLNRSASFVLVALVGLLSALGLGLRRAHRHGQPDVIRRANG